MDRWRNEAGELVPAIQRWIREHACGEPGISQVETTEVERAIERADGGVELVIHYVFDRDCFSQYDRTETYTGRIVLDAELRPIDGALTRSE